jgi:hypothetical protein
MHSVSDLTTFARKTKGDVPPPLVVRVLSPAIESTSSKISGADSLHPPGRIHHCSWQQDVSLRMFLPNYLVIHNTTMRTGWPTGVAPQDGLRHVHF